MLYVFRGALVRLLFELDDLGFQRAKMLPFYFLISGLFRDGSVDSIFLCSILSPLRLVPLK